MSGGLRLQLQDAAMWLRQVQVMTIKDLRQLHRDRVLFIYTVYIFSLNIFIAAGGVSQELRNAGLLVFDADKSEASRELAYRFRPPYFERLGEIEHQDTALRRLDRGKAMAVLDIPERFGETLRLADEAASVQMLIDTSRANTGYLASSYAQRIVADYGREWGEHRLSRAGADVSQLPVIENERRFWHNPDLEESWFSATAELLTMMTVACILLPAASLVREKERGTIEQLLVSPLTPFQVMLAKVLAMAGVMILGVTVALFFIMQPFFGVPFRGSIALFYALTVLYAFTNAGLGLVAGTFARNSGQMGMIVILIVMPIILLSGTWTQLESMPEFLRMAMNLSPLRHFIEIAFSILLRGAGIDVLWDSVLAMVLLGVVLFALSLWRFRRQFG